jgi:hypothetical protein
MAKRKSIIPNRYLTGLRTLAALPKPTQEALIQTLRGAEPITSISEVINVVSHTIDLEREKLTEVIDAIVSLTGAIINDRKEEQKEFLESVVENAEAQFKKEKYDWDTFRQTIHGIADLEESSLGLILKTRSASIDRPLVLLSTEVISDIRPVFYTDSSKQPLVSAIIQSLRVQYMENREEKTSYFAIDMNDINTLIVQLEAARIRHETLREVLRKASIITYQDGG